MNIKQKNWVWWITWPFAHNNYTTIGDTIYYPKGHKPTETVIDHEKIHAMQQKKEGVLWFILKYLLFLPVFYNPFRYRMEYEAYKQAQGYSDEKIHSILSSYKYGWLKWR